MLRCLCIMFCCVFICSFELLANNPHPVLTGILTSLSKEPVPGAYITIKGNITHTTTDLDGKFEIYNLNPGKYILEITAIGYKTLAYPIEILAEKPQYITITFEEDPVVFPEIMIIGKSNKLFFKVPGSVNYIDNKQIKNTNPLSGNEIFKKIPGLHVVEEEGVGMRINMGVRGLDPDRSRSLLILEDGVPVALAPYGEPEMYYTPSMERMSGIEILKGSGQILYGPQTIGGVVNYITSPPPLEETGKIKIQAGTGGYLNGLFTYGNTMGNVGYNVSLLKKRADQIGTAQFDITDINAKLSFVTDTKNNFSFKLGFYNESSNSTYIGITQSMYDVGNQDYVLMAPDDNLKVRRYSLSGVYDKSINHRSSLKTTLFAYSTTRDWRRQDFVYNGSENKKPSQFTGVTWGDESIKNGAVYMRNTTANRNRQFEVAGVESRYTLDYNLLGKPTTIKAGMRYVYEIAFEQRINGSKPNAVSGELVENENRPGNAASIYVHQQTSVHPKFDIHYGVRYEYFQQERLIYRSKFSNGIKDTFISNINSVGQLIPGVGLTWKWSKNYMMFGGLHTGFAPPRTKDAISNQGEVYHLEAEKSVNTELGIRMNPTKGIFVEITGFHMNFSNQIIPVSESSGGSGTGLVNGGQTFHRGIESGFELNVSELIGQQKNKWLVYASTTFVQAKFAGERHMNGESLSGNTTPYAPEWTVNSHLEYESTIGLTARLGFHYVAKQFTDELNTITGSADGRTGLIPSYSTFDANVRYYILPWKTHFFCSVKNFTNERFIVSRRPQGIRVGLPTLFMAGFEWEM